MASPAPSPAQLPATIVTQMFGGSGFLPGQFQPTSSLQDNQRSQRLSGDQQRAMGEAGRLDQQFLTQAVLGAMNLVNATPEQRSTQRRIAAERAGRLLSQVTTGAAGIAPELAEQLGGSRGLAANMARHVVEGLRNTNYGTAQAGRFTRELHGQLFNRNVDPNTGQARLRDLNGLGAARAGQLFDELIRRGLLPMLNDREQFNLLMNERTPSGTVSERLSRRERLQDIVAGNPQLQDKLRRADVGRSADLIEQWSGAVAAVKDLYQAHGQPQVGMSEVFSAIEVLTGGAGGGMNPGNVEMMVRRAHQRSRDTPGGLTGYLAMLRQGSQMAEAAGVDRTVGAQSAASSSAFGAAFGRLAGRQGAGGLSRGEATALDQQLRISAAASPMANTLGAIMAMHADGLIKQGPAMEIVTAIQQRNQTSLNQLTRSTPQQIRQLLIQSGVSASASAQYLQAREANQEFVAKHNLQDVVRQMQGQGEVANLMRAGLQTGMAGSLREAGLTRAEMTRVQRQASEAARQALMNMDGDLLSSSEPATRQRRNGQVANAIATAIGSEMQQKIGNEKMLAMAAAAIRGLEASMQRNPGLRRFRNMAGLVTMNRGDVMSDANRTAARDDEEARVASLTAGIGQSPVLARVMDAVAGAGPNERLRDVILPLLGAVRRPDVAAALEPVVRSIRNNQSTARNLSRQISQATDPQVRNQLTARFQQVREQLQQQTRSALDVVRELDASETIRNSEQAQIAQLPAAAPAAAPEAPDPTATPTPQPAAPPSSVMSYVGMAGSSVTGGLRAVGSSVTGGLRAVGSGIMGGLFDISRASSPPDFHNALVGRGYTQQVESLQRRDREVRLQEAIHHEAAGPHAAGPPQYVWRTGPDGKPYAIGGHVMMDMSPVRGDPAATARKMAQVRRAAHAPSEAGGAAGSLSADDTMLAHRASQMEQQALLQLSSPASTWPTSQAMSSLTGSSDFQELFRPRASTAAETQPAGGGSSASSAGPTRIVGTLTIRADGASADLDAFPNSIGSPPSASAF